MSTTERIRNEIKSLDRAELDELFEWILQFIEAKRQTKTEGALSRLAQIQIDGPEDFSANHDLYVTGEKSATGDLH
jgi:hypothetical protein